MTRDAALADQLMPEGLAFSKQMTRPVNSPQTCRNDPRHAETHRVWQRRPASRRDYSSLAETRRLSGITPGWRQGGPGLADNAVWGTEGGAEGSEDGLRWYMRDGRGRQDVFSRWFDV